MKFLVVDDQKLPQFNILNQLDHSFTVIESSSFENDAFAEEAYELSCQDVYIQGNDVDHISESVNQFIKRG